MGSTPIDVILTHPCKTKLIAEVEVKSDKIGARTLSDRLYKSYLAK